MMMMMMMMVMMMIIIIMIGFYEMGLTQEAVEAQTGIPALTEMEPRQKQGDFSDRNSEEQPDAEGKYSGVVCERVHIGSLGRVGARVSLVFGLGLALEMGRLQAKKAFLPSVPCNSPSI